MLYALTLSGHRFGVAEVCRAGAAGRGQVVHTVLRGHMHRVVFVPGVRNGNKGVC